MCVNVHSQKRTTGNPPKANINAYLPLRSKCWLRGGVGGQFPRNVWWSLIGIIIILGDYKILVFLYKSYAGYPGFLRFRAQNSLHFFSASTGYTPCLCHKRFFCVHCTSKRDCQCPLLYLKNYSNLLFKYNLYKENFLVEEYDKGDGAYIQREKKLTKLPESTQWTIIHL